MRNWRCPYYLRCLDRAARANAPKLNCHRCKHKRVEAPIIAPDLGEVRGLWLLLEKIFDGPIPVEPEREVPFKFDLVLDLPLSEWKITPTPGRPGSPPWFDKK